MSKKEGVFARLKKIKHIEIIVAVVAVLIMLIVYFTSFSGGGSGGGSSGGGNGGTAGTTQYSDYCARMQNEVNTYVSKIKGAGQTKAVINWESGVELLLAATESNSSSSSTSSPVIINISGGSQPIIIKELYPKAIGVVVVCEGGSDAAVKVSIVMSVATLLDISTDKVIVLPMNKSK